MHGAIKAFVHGFFISLARVVERQRIAGYCSPSLMGYNTIIYGHNMRDNSMFARLKEFKDEETYKRCRYFWVMTPFSDNFYEICSIHEAAPGSDSFMLRFLDLEAYEGWLDKMSALSTPATDVKFECGDRIVTLSTCTQDESLRMVVQGRLIYKEERT